MLTQGRNTTEAAEGGKIIKLPVKASTRIFDGGMVAIDSNGFAIPAIKQEGLIVAGRAENYSDNRNGADGEIQVIIKRGTFKWKNDTENPIEKNGILKNCYILDDETVTALNTGTSIAGKVVGIENDGILVETL